MVVGALLFGINAHAADGDLIVNGNLAVSGSVSAPNVLTKYYESAEQPITRGGSLSLTHGLGTAPLLVIGLLKCKTAEHGYSVGDVLVYSLASSPWAGVGHFGMAAVISATTIDLRYGAQGITILNKTAGHNVYINTANWSFIVRAWAM